MLHVKIYRLDSSEVTGISGGVSISSIDTLKCESISPIKKSLAGGFPGTFEMSEVNISGIHGQPASWLQDYSYDRPYAVEIQYGSAWDAVDSDCVFYGIVERESVTHSAKTGQHNLSAVSWDGHMKAHPDVTPRWQFKAVMKNTFDSTNPDAFNAWQGAQIRLKDPLEDGAIDDYLKTGSVILATGSAGESSFDLRMIVANKSTDGHFRNVRVLTGKDSGLKRGDVTWYYNPPPDALPFGFNISNLLKVIHIPLSEAPSLTLGGAKSKIQLVSKASGQVVFASSWRTTEESKVSVSGGPPGTGDEIDTLKVTLDSKIPPGLATANYELQIIEPFVINGGSEVTIMSPNFYSSSPESTDGIGGYSTLPFSVAPIIHGLCSRVRGLAGILHPTLVQLGTPGQLPRYALPSSNPAEALTEMQQATDAFVILEPSRSGVLGERVNGNGARKIQLIIDDRRKVPTEIGISAPIDFSGKSVGLPWDYAIVEAEPINDVVQDVKPSGWYPTTLGFDEISRLSKSALKIEAKLLLPLGRGTVYAAGSKIVAINDASLSDVAKRYWDFFESFHLQQNVSMDGILDFSAQDGFSSQPYIGKVIVSSVAPANRKAFVISQSVDYVNRKTSFEVLAQTGVYTPSAPPPVAVLRQSPYSWAGNQSIFDASASYGEGITFKWHKNDVLVAGETSNGLVAQVVDGDVIKVTVTDIDQQTSTDSVVATTIAPETGDPLSVPTLDSSFSGAADSDTEHVRIVARKHGAEMQLMYKVEEKGVFDAESGDILTLHPDTATNELDAVIQIPRPTETLARRDPIKFLHVKVLDLTYGVNSQWDVISIQRNYGASLLSLVAQRVSDTEVNVQWVGDLDTDNVAISIRQIGGSVLGSATSGFGSGDTIVTISEPDDTKAIIVDVTANNGAATGETSSTTVGSSGASLRLQYSVENGTPDWHDVFVEGEDKWMRQKVGVEGVWSAGVKIVGEDGAKSYTWIKYADDAFGTGLSDSPTDKEYIGIAVNKTVATESAAPGDYVWSLLKGDQGVPGPSGDPTYTWIKYADNAAGSGISDSPVGKTYIGLAYNKTVAAESTDPAQYTWSLFKGDTGATGATGATGSTGATGPAGADAVIYYIKPTTGTAIKNGTGTITLEARKVEGGADSLLSSGSIQLFEGSTGVGYSKTYNASSIAGFKIVTLGPTPSDIKDSITIVDLTDGSDGSPGADAIFGYIEASNGLAYVQDKNSGSWSPNTSATDLDCTFLDGGTVVARISRRITLSTGTGTVTASVTTHPSGDLNTGRVAVTITGNGTGAVSVRYSYSYAGRNFTVSERVVASRGGDLGATGPAGATGATGAMGPQGAQGLPGSDGSYMELVYKRSATAPTAPTGGGIPAGWADTPPADDGNFLWMSKAEKDIGGALASGASWSAPVRVSNGDGPVIESFDLEWGSLSTAGQTITLDYQLSNGGTEINWVVQENTFTTPPSGGGATTGGASGRNITLATSKSLGEVITVWLRASAGTIKGDWIRHVMVNRTEVQIAEPSLVAASNGSANYRDAVFTVKSTKAGLIRLEYIVDTSIQDPSGSGVIMSSSSSALSVTIPNVQVSSYSKSTDTLTRRYIHIRARGNEIDLLHEGWMTFQLPISNAISVATSGSKDLISGSSYNDRIWLDMDELIPGVTVYCERESGDSRAMISNIDTVHETLDQAKPYRYEFLSKSYTDVPGTGSATYRLKVYDGSFNQLFSGIRTVGAF